MSSSFCIFPVQRKGAVRGQNAARYREREDMSMISEKMKPLVNNNSAIRAMFEEGKRLAAIYGAENVYDFSLGNPNVPAPRRSMRRSAGL